MLHRIRRSLGALMGIRYMKSRPALSARCVLVLLWGQSLGRHTQPTASLELSDVTPDLEDEWHCAGAEASCAESNCCRTPGHRCFRSMHNASVARCLKHPPGPCQDTPHWKCPGMETCSGNFQDCRKSLCCTPAEHFGGRENAPFACMRRPNLYYAQCRPAKWLLAASPASGAPGPGCDSSEEWECPGWEECVPEYAECTKSRCCIDKDFSCYLNTTDYEAGGGWHAFCMPTINVSDATNATLSACASVLEMGSIATWLCRRGQRITGSEYVKRAREYVKEVDPVLISLIATLALFLAACVCVCACINRHAMRGQLLAMERDMEMLRASQRGGCTADGSPKRAGRHFLAPHASRALDVLGRKRRVGLSTTPTRPQGSAGY